MDKHKNIIQFLIVIMDDSENPFFLGATEYLKTYDLKTFQSH